MNFVDTHCHLNDEKFSEDLLEVLERAKISGVNRIINFGDTLKSSAAVVELATKFEELYAGVGIHPEEISGFNENSAEKIIELAKNKKVVAIGEIGLDYYWEKDSEKRLQQQKIFIEQLEIARQVNLPVCIHEREAHGDALKILKTEGKNLRGVMHCYSGSLEMAKELWKMGWLIGVDGPLTFKNSAKLPEIVKAAPREMILIETDAPYLAPVPNRGKRNEPSFVIDVAKKIAEIRGETLETVAQYTTKNAENLYNIGVK
ncbi:MAG: TatD family hydrolase [Selenomonadaceae bacterium]|nr:TatD family hydrolase [Selenomonadaceae bacterium]